MTCVADLAGAELALWVARCQGWRQELLPITQAMAWFDDKGRFTSTVADWMPHEDWSQGGPIIEENLITVTPEPYDDGPTLRLAWVAVKAIYGMFSHPPSEKLDGYRGKTYLIAAMRCFIASKYGDTIPDQPPS